MIFHYLVRVWIPNFDQWDRRSFAGEVASGLAHYLERGADHLHHLMDISDWNLPRLETGEKWRPYRKPRIDLRVLLTSRDGLAVEWAPRGWWDEIAPRAQEYDFIRFDTNREIGDGHPNNRLFYLKDFGALMRPGRQIKPEEGSLIRATDGYIRSLVEELHVSFDVRILENFDVLEGQPDKRRTWERPVIGAEIFNVEQRAAEHRKAELAAWENEHLQPYGLQTVTVCEAFREHDRSAAKAARQLSQRASKSVTTAQARKWLDALERRLGRLDKPLKTPTAKVIELRSRRD